MFVFYIIIDYLIIKKCSLKTFTQEASTCSWLDHNKLEWSNKGSSLTRINLSVLKTDLSLRRRRDPRRVTKVPLLREKKKLSKNLLPLLKNQLLRLPQLLQLHQPQRLLKKLNSLLLVRVLTSKKLTNLYLQLSHVVILSKFNQLKATSHQSGMTPFQEDMLRFFSLPLPLQETFSMFMKILFTSKLFSRTVNLSNNSLRTVVLVEEKWPRWTKPSKALEISNLWQLNSWKFWLITRDSVRSV